MIDFLKRHCISIVVAVSATIAVLLIKDTAPPPAPAPVSMERKQPMLSLPSFGSEMTAVPMGWNSVTARNSRNLRKAFEEARDNDRPEAWLTAADIAATCYISGVSTGPTEAIDAKIGEYNSTKATAPDRVIQLALLDRRKAARAELEKRCKGFAESDLATVRELRAKAEASDTTAGRLMRTRSSNDPQQWASATSEALLSADPVLTRMALYSMAQMMPKDKEVSTFAALLAAQARIAGDDRTELDVLAICVIAGACDQYEGKPPTARQEALIGQYERALRKQDVVAILKIKP